MPDLDELEADRFQPEIAARQQPYGLKGSTHLDWGMQYRLARIFDPTDHRTVMLAVDHGYFQGPTSGLERIDVDIAPLAEHADALMITRGALRAAIPPSLGSAVVLRASGGPSILADDLSHEVVAVDAADVARLDVAALAVQVFIGGEGERQSVENLTRLVDLGSSMGVPVMAVTAVGRELTRDARYLRLATRICAELGARIVKTYHCDEGFETVTSACPVPIVMAGGRKLPELEALEMSHRAMAEGASGVDMGRNIFQSEAPEAMLRAVRGVVHENLEPDEAYATYLADRLLGREVEHGS